MVWALVGRAALAIAPTLLGSVFNNSSGANGQQNTGPSLMNRAGDGLIGMGLGNTAEMLIPGEQEGFGTALTLAGAAGAFNEAGSDENSMLRMAGAVAGVFLAHMALTQMGMDPNSMVSKGIMAAAAYGGATLVGRMTDSSPAPTETTAAPQQQLLAAPG